MRETEGLFDKMETEMTHDRAQYAAIQKVLFAIDGAMNAFENAMKNDRYSETTKKLRKSYEKLDEIQDMVASI